MKPHIVLCVTCILLGAGCAFDQTVKHSDDAGALQEDDEIKEIPGIIDQNDIPTESDVEVIEPDPVKLDMLPFHSKLCTDDPFITEIGSGVHPIDAKYGDLYFLGQLFTAARCGQGRVNELWGIRDGMYVVGSTISLKEPPDEEMTSVLRWIGFTCDEGIGDGVCTRWELTDEVPYENLLYLEPFHNRIEADDCRNCG